MLSAHTRVFAILGDPVGHSLSPCIHNAAFAAAELDAVFVALRAHADGVANLVRTLARAGGGGSVTVPHKEVAVEALDRRSEAVQQTGACNTFWAERGRVCGDNTDVAGFRAAAAHHGVELAGAQVLLLGAGGAAAAVLVALGAAQADVRIVNRTAARAHALVARTGVPAEVAAELSDEPFDVIINATSLGLAASDPMPLAVERIPPGAMLLDLAYAPGGTPWVRAARTRGISAFDGSEMLLRQAAAAFRCWTNAEAPVAAMRQALENALAGS